MKTCIIGLGETGKAIAALLINKYSHSSVTILDPSASISGRLLDLQHAASFTENYIYINDFERASESEYIFYCAGIRNKKSQDRSTTAKTNKKLLIHILGQFSPIKNAKIIVLTNPVESVTGWIDDILNKNNIVVGTGTYLDQYRLKWILHQYNQSPFQSIEIDVLGEHGEGMTPIYSSATIENKKLTSLLTEKKQDQITAELKKSAETIRLTEKATSYGVAQCALQILEAFESNLTKKLTLSTEITKEYQQLLGIKEQFYFSIPCEISTRGLKKMAPLKMNSKELTSLITAAHNIISISKKR